MRDEKEDRGEVSLLDLCTEFEQRVRMAAKSDGQKREEEKQRFQELQKVHGILQKQIEVTQLENRELKAKLEESTKRHNMLDEVQTENRKLQTELEESKNKVKSLEDVFSGQKLSDVSDEELERLHKQFSKERKSRRSCVVCLQAPRGVVCIPCGHVCLCMECSKGKLTNCPLCRVEIKEFCRCYI